MFGQLRQSGTLANPLRAGPVLRALTDAVSVDSTLSSRQMLSLALGLHGLSMSRIVFATAPYLGTGSVNGLSIVRLNPAADRRCWRAFEYDSLPSFMRTNDLSHPGPSIP